MTSLFAPAPGGLLRHAQRLGFWFAAFACVIAFAAESAKRRFRIEAGEAATTLRQFATQAAEQVVYPADAVRGVTTRAVRGDFTPLEALGQMIAGTTLVVVKDETTGALSVRKDGVAEKNAESRPASDRAAATGTTSGTAAAPRSVPAGTGAVEGRVKNAVTGAYLNNARVSVPGTTLLAFTDESGTYRLAGVAAGAVTLEVFYTGLDPQAAAVTVAAGQSVERNVDLTSVARYGDDAKVVKLDSYKVASTRETDIEAIAINEQRFAPNIKNVISTETLGDPLGGSMGDFLRFLPGVSAAYGALETEGVLIRGFPSNYSVVALDGVQLAGANLSGERDFTPSRIGVNSVSRVEVTKVPLPSTPADTMSGSINLVSKSAFERSRAELKFRAGLSSNEQSFAFKKTPAPSNKRTYKVYPDLSFDYTLPIGKRLGLVVTGLHSTSSFQTDTWYTDYLANGTATGATPANPYMQRTRNVDVYRSYERNSLSARVDWRPSTHGVLSVGGMVTRYNQENPNSQFNPTVGSTGTSTVAGGTALSYTPDRVVGATGRGSVPMAFSFLTSGGLSKSANVRYRLDDGTWRIQSAFSTSNSFVTRRDIDEGFFNALGVGLRVPVRVTLSDIRGGKVGDFQVFDNANQPVDAFDINNYNLTTATNQPKTDIRSTIAAGDLDVRRQLRWFSFPLAVQVGGLHRIQTNDDRRLNGRAYNYNGLNGSLSAAPYLSDVFYGSTKLASFPDKPYVPWVSPHKVYAAFKANPALFTQTVAQQRTTASNNILNSKHIEEKVTAGYFQTEARFLNNRLNVVTGVRYEGTTDEGIGPLQDPNAVFVRTATGAFARTPAGARIRKPEAGAAGSVEEVALIYKERASRAERSYHGYYPSLHLTFNATERLMVRAAYAKTYGRPNFSNIIPNTTVSQDDDLNQDPEKTLGRINVSNIGLKPWTADNYDVSVEYYTDHGGVVSGGVFLKEVKDFFGAYVKDATAADLATLGLDPRYLGWRVTTQFNSGSARVRGAEINLRHSLVPFGTWGRQIIVFANATKLKLDGHDLADFTGFLPESVNWGFTIAKGRATLITKWNYRGEQKAVSYPDMGPDAFRFPQPRTQLDISLDYQVGKRASLYFNLRNATNEVQNEFAYGSQTPGYAREFYHANFGRVFTLGVKGAF
ncbi:TonB-dependent receptor domain-containing protein [Horticoccus sp. 23ND18S-11]|uniref:TonB-dependent receptor domain-containing protein n=1 Tax=Horticoccus sp. 23ND18S-11 TaxID=3391832 RepID=UPI0039C9C0FB